MNVKNLVSVIVPIYNVEKYLERCVDSIVKQTYLNLEIILVDDGSTDSSGALCDKLAKKDTRIKAIHKCNGGLSDARNKAIDEADGEYLYFVDSDDYIPLDSIEYLLNKLKDSKSDIAIGGMLTTSKLDENVAKEETYTVTLNNKEAVRELFYGSYYTTSASAKLYKASLFDEIRYPYGKLNEDLFTTYKLLNRAERVVCSDKTVYYYYHRPGSIMNSAFNERKLDVMRALDQIERDIDLEDYEAKPAFGALNLSLSSALLAEKPDRQYVEEYGIWKRIKDNRSYVLKDSRVNKTIKSYALLSFLGEGLFVYIYNLYYGIKWRD